MTDDAKPREQLLEELQSLRAVLSEIGYRDEFSREDDPHAGSVIVAPGTVVIRLASDLRILDWNLAADRMEATLMAARQAE